MTTRELYSSIGVSCYEHQACWRKGGIFHIQMEGPQSCHKCPKCGDRNVIHRGTFDRMVRAPRIGLDRTVLFIKAPRLECRRCQQVLNAMLPQVEPHCNYTKSLAKLVVDLRKMMTIKDVAHYVGVSDTMIRGIDKKYLNRKFGKPRLRHLEIIAIDEIYVGKKNKFFTIVIDWMTGAIVFVGDGKGEKALKPFWKRLRGSKANIKAVATDMASAYYSAVLKNLPNAKHVFDRFHIVKLMLAIAYYLKEDLGQIWQQPNKTIAGRFLKDWCARARASRIKVLQTMANTLEGHRTGILNWYDFPISTGRLEGINNKIGALQRSAYGYRDRDYFIAKLYALHLAKFELIG